MPETGSVKRVRQSFGGSSEGSDRKKTKPALEVSFSGEDLGVPSGYHQGALLGRKKRSAHRQASFWAIRAIRVKSVQLVAVQS